MSIRRAQDERLEGTPDGLNAISEIMDVPDAPTIGTATDLETGSTASVTFTAATTGGTATTYTVTSTPGSFTGTGASSPITVSGLTTGTAYTFKVKGTNATGIVGPESVASNSLTLTFPYVGTYDSLATVTVPSGGLASVTFAGIPAGYRHLQLRALTRSDRAGSGFDYLLVRANGDTGSNYAWHYLYGNGSAANASGSPSQTSMGLGVNPQASATASAFGTTVIDILDYTNTSKYKTFKGLAGQELNTTNGVIGFHSGLWMNTSAITSLTLLNNVSGNIVQHSQLTLYGVK